MCRAAGAAPFHHRLWLTPCGFTGAAELLAAFRAHSPRDTVVRECKCRGACKSAPVVQLTTDESSQKLKVREGRQQRVFCGASLWLKRAADAPMRRACAPRAQRVHASEVPHLLSLHHIV